MLWTGCYKVRTIDSFFHCSMAKSKGLVITSSSSQPVMSSTLSLNTTQLPSLLPSKQSLLLKHGFGWLAPQGRKGGEAGAALACNPRRSGAKMKRSWNNANACSSIKYWWALKLIVSAPIHQSFPSWLQSTWLAENTGSPAYSLQLSELKALDTF